jgi:hypothetical protein
LAKITPKQIADRKITQTVFIPLPLAIDLDNAANELGVSRNKIINVCTTLGLQDKAKLRNALLEGNGLPASDPNQPATVVVPNAITTPSTTQGGSTPKEVSKEVDDIV